MHLTYYRAAFPLILTFSPGEKEHVTLPPWNVSAALIGISAEFLERGKRLSLNQKNYRKSIAVILARRGNHFSFSLGEKAGMRVGFSFPTPS